MRRISVFLAAALSLAIVAKPAQADVVIDDLGGCDPEVLGIGYQVSGDQVLRAGQILANIAPRVNVRFIIGDKVNGNWPESVRRSIVSAGTSRQFPILITCSRGDGPDLTLRNVQLRWKEPRLNNSNQTLLSMSLGFPNGVRMLVPYLWPINNYGDDNWESLF